MKFVPTAAGELPLYPLISCLCLEPWQWHTEKNSTPSCLISPTSSPTGLFDSSHFGYLSVSRTHLAKVDPFSSFSPNTDPVLFSSQHVRELEIFSFIYRFASVFSCLPPLECSLFEGWSLKRLKNSSYTDVLKVRTHQD